MKIISRMKTYYFISINSFLEMIMKYNQNIIIASFNYRYAIIL